MPCVLLRQCIVRIYNSFCTLYSQMQVAHSGLKAAMSQQFFYSVQIGTIIYKVCCKAMADGMYAIVFTAQPKLYQRFLYQVLNAAYTDRPPWCAAIK